MAAMKALFILNDPPYVTERCYNAMRLAHALSKRAPETEIAVFLVADGVVAASRGQKILDGFYSLEHMLERVIAAKRSVLVCGTCMGARGVTEDDLLEGARRSTMDELAQATAVADKVLVF